MTAETECPRSEARWLRRELARMLRRLAPGGRLELSVILVDDERMRELNRGHRGIDEPTDVLAFPQMEAGEVQAMLEGGPPEGGGREPLGDIVIDMPLAARQAAERGTDSRDEVELLAAHGLLHLMGMEDDSEEGAEAMAEEAARLTGGKR